MQWNFAEVKTHKGLILGIVLVGGLILYLYWRGGQTNAQASPAAGTAVYGGINPSVQAAEVNAAGQIQLAQVNANQQTQQINATLTAQAQHDAYQFALAKLDAATSTTQQANQLTTQQNIAQMSANVQTGAIAAQEAVQQAGIDAQTKIAQLNDQAAVTTTSLNDSMALQISLAQTAATQTIATAPYAAAVAEANIQGDVAKTVVLSQAATSQDIVDLIRSGQLNKGGAGGAAQISALAALTGQPYIAGAAYGAAQNMGAASIISRIGQAGSGILSSLFA